MEVTVKAGGTDDDQFQRFQMRLGPSYPRPFAVLSEDRVFWLTRFQFEVKFLTDEPQPPFAVGDRIASETVHQAKAHGLAVAVLE